MPPSASASTTTAPVESDPLTIRFQSVLSSLGGLRTQITGVQNELRALERDVARELKAYRRESAKGKVKAPRKPSGFAKASPISDDLCSFMQKDAGTQVARTEVTRFLIKYIQDNGLQNVSDRREIVPNDPLKDLLGLETGQKLSYFELQKHMNRHFPKAGAH